MSESTETWRNIPVDPYSAYYEVSDRGRLRVCKGRQGTTVGMLLQPTPRRDGWCQWTLKAPKSPPLTMLCQRAVALAFIPNPSKLSDVGFLDGDKENFCVENLYWTDRAESMKEAGVKRRGEANHMTRLSDDQVRELRRRAVTEPLTGLAKEFGIALSHCSNIVSGKARGHVV